MFRKVVGMFIIGLLFATMIPVGSSAFRTTDEQTFSKDISSSASQLVITIKGGFGVNAIIKNIGTTDIERADVSIILDGSMIFWGKEKVGGTISIGAGKTHYLISPILGFGNTNIEISIDTTVETASAKVLLGFVFGVE